MGFHVKAAYADPPVTSGTVRRERQVSDPGSRSYSPAIGRWLSRDWVREEGGAALYAFLENEPVATVDVLGLLEYQLARRYFREWMEQFGKDDPLRPVADSYYKRPLLMRGCISVVLMNLGMGGFDGNPDLGNCYGTREQAEKRSKEMDDGKECSGKCGPGGRPARPRLFAVQYPFVGDEQYKADEKTGKVDTSQFAKYHLDRKGPHAADGVGEFNYAIYDEAKDEWVYAGRARSGFVIHGTEEDLAKLQKDKYDRTIYCVACEDFPYVLGPRPPDSSQDGRGKP